MEVAACNAAGNETGRNSVLTLVRTTARSVCKQQDSNYVGFPNRNSGQYYFKDAIARLSCFKE